MFVFLLTAGLLASMVFARVFASGFDAAFFVAFRAGFFTAAFFLSAGWSTGATTSPFDLWLRAAFFAGFFAFVTRLSKLGVSSALAKLLSASLIFALVLELVAVFFYCVLVFSAAWYSDFVLRAISPHQAQNYWWLVCWNLQLD